MVLNRAGRLLPVQRLIAGFLPATIIPAIVSIGMVAIYTRLLSPVAYGRYSLAFTTLTVIQASLFYSAGMSIVRFLPMAQRKGNERDFLRTTYTSLFLVALLVAIIACLVVGFVPLPRKLAPVLWLAIPLLLLRAGVAANQAVNRARANVLPYTLVEGGQALIAFAAGLALVLLRGPQAGNLMLGLLAGSAAMFIAGLPSLLRAVWGGRFNVAQKTELLRYSAPLCLTYAACAALQYGDRFLIGALAGAQVLGIYTVAFTLVERPTSLVGVAVTTATFPLVVKTLEREGLEAARRQAGSNGIMLLAVAAPACLGLMLIARRLAAVMVGPEFRNGLVIVLPIIAATALIRIMSSHFVDHAYHLARRTELLLAAYTPFAVLNIAADLFTIPRYGMVGAAWTAFACLLMQLIVSVFIARRIFPIWLPPGDVLRIGAALVPMALVASLIHTGNPWLDLAEAIVASGTVYMAMVLALDIAGARALLSAPFRGVIAGQEKV